MNSNLLTKSPHNPRLLVSSLDQMTEIRLDELAEEMIVITIVSHSGLLSWCVVSALTFPPCCCLNGDIIFASALVVQSRGSGRGQTYFTDPAMSG